ncbi:hypothetical protein Tco_1487347, partial [Tanacetum coccineum]
DQTVPGKDYSNLLIADSLLKTIWFVNAPCYGNEALASPKANGFWILLSIEDKLNYLEHPIPATPVAAQPGQQVAPEALAAHAAWVKGSKEIAGLMLLAMEPEI